MVVERMGTAAVGLLNARGTTHAPFAMLVRAAGCVYELSVDELLGLVEAHETPCGLLFLLCLCVCVCFDSSWPAQPSIWQAPCVL